MGIDPATHRLRFNLSSLLNPSGRVGLSSLLGLEAPLSSELLQIVTANLLSAQCPNPAFLQQNSLREQLPSQQQLSINTPIQEQSQPFFSPLEIMPASSDQLQSSGHQLNLWESNSMLCGSLEGLLTPLAEPGFDSSAPTMSAFDPVLEASSFDPKSGPTFGIPPAMPTPVSSPTPLNSSSTYITSTTTTAEDERDSYCSSVLDLQMLDLWDVGGFMQEVFTTN